MVNNSSYFTIHNLLTAHEPQPVLEQFYNQIRDKKLVRISVVIDNAITISFTGDFRVSLYNLKLYDIFNYRPEWNPIGDEYITINDEARAADYDYEEGTYGQAPVTAEVIITPEGDEITSNTEPVPEND